MSTARWGTPTRLRWRHGATALVSICSALVAGCGSSTSTPASGAGGPTTQASGQPAPLGTPGGAPVSGALGDPCALINPADVQAVLGVTVGPGKEELSNAEARRCSALTTTFPIQGAQLWTLTAAYFQQNKTYNVAGAVVVTATTGVGDEAFFESFTGTHTTSLFVRRGSLYIAATIRLPDGGTETTREDADRRFANLVLARNP